MAGLPANEKRAIVRSLGEIAPRVNNLDAMQNGISDRRLIPSLSVARCSARSAR